ncbi:MAG TPA: Clp protease N-terminal domain-containing protein [Microbacterium sp.]|uniref:Clp protease N-terminal domain-containing protein n=1 Tax=Microbacterium sp. TaxID=51671 RepID=UPI002C6FDE15|nr:Clp protease N-terminal domain-containing protein [Microbacterium sp.]HWI30865.1 Clp protease N-terminal domain-containing protein [Microbacterium sp.]
MSGPITPAATAVLVRAAEEATRRGDRRIGTDHLLLGLLHDPAVARTLGTDVEQARVAAQRLDRLALAAIGIELGTKPAQVSPRRAGSGPPTSGLRGVIARAVAMARAENVRKAEPRHLLAALLEGRRPDPAAELLDALDTRPEDPARRAP